jgi:hypothetical protein
VVAQFIAALAELVKLLERASEADEAAPAEDDAGGVDAAAEADDDEMDMDEEEYNEWW